MNKLLLAAAATLLAAGVATAKNPDPVLMTVDGQDISVSEFEYLFNKNNTQQSQPESLDDYLQMFINYRLKVADAEHQGLQNSPEFKFEYEKFRNDLAKPYLRDQATEERLIQESYAHMGEDVSVSHIMMPLDDSSKAVLDSVRSAIIEGKMTFGEAAAKFSIDRGSSTRGGNMGYVFPNRYPWAFEEMAYNTPVGQISPVVNSGMGYHLILVDQRSSDGEVDASHILLMTRGMDAAGKAVQEARADSIYNALMAGADFADLATRFSQDPGSADKGGELGFFRRGAMVHEFDSTAFALADGEISRPVVTPYGYHIIKRNGHRGVGPLDEALRKQIIDAMARDERSTLPDKVALERFRSEHNAYVDLAALEQIKKYVAARAAGYDSTCIAELTAMDLPVGIYDSGVVTIGEIMPSVPKTSKISAENVPDLIAPAAEAALSERILDVEREKLAATNPEYRNLINEYRNGILLFDASNRRVWDRAAKDTEGLNEFFNTNRAKYAWDEPRFKSYVIFTPNDSTLDLAMAYADSVYTPDYAEFNTAMRKRFGRDIKIERVIAAKGENAITDYLGFDQPKPEPQRGSRWTSYKAYRGRLLTQPEEATDVRGAAVTDYQAELDRQWVEELRAKYSFNVNKKVFKKLLKNHK